MQAPASGSAYERAAAALAAAPRRPRMVVFDGDFVVWKGELERLAERVPDAFPDAAAVLAALHAHDVVLALTSTAPAQPGAAHGLFEALGLAHMLRSVHLRPAAGSGAAREAALVDALRAVRAETGIALSEALFFDDGVVAVSEVARLGLTCRSASEGLSPADLEAALEAFAANLVVDRGF